MAPSRPRHITTDLFLYFPMLSPWLVHFRHIRRQAPQPVSASYLHCYVQNIGPLRWLVRWMLLFLLAADFICLLCKVERELLYARWTGIFPFSSFAKAVIPEAPSLSFRFHCVIELQDYFNNGTFFCVLVYYSPFFL